MILLRIDKTQAQHIISRIDNFFAIDHANTWIISQQIGKIHEFFFSPNRLDKFMIILPEINETRNFFVADYWTTELIKANFTKYELYTCKYVISLPKFKIFHN